MKGDAFIKKNYLTMPQKQMAKELNRSHCYVRGRLKKLKLKIPKKIRDAFKRRGQIKKGSVSWNKGRKMSKERYERCAPTMFKKGNIPANTMHDGAIVKRQYRIHRNGRVYKWIRISKANWRMLHVFNWEKKKGKVPKGSMVAFKTKNTMNCNVSNLFLITMADNMLRNTIHRYPEDVKAGIRLVASLNRRIRKTIKTQKYGKK